MTQLLASGIDSLELALSGINSDSVKINLHYDIAYRERRGNTEDALQHIFIAKELSNYNKSYKLGELSLLKAKILKHRGEIDAAKESCIKSIEIFRNNNQKRRLINAINLFGWLEYKAGNFDNAKTQFEKALSYSNTIKDSLLIAVNLNDIGAAMYSQGQYPEATKYYLEALAIREDMNNERGMMIGYNNLGIVYKKNHNIEKAIEYYNNGLQIAKSLDDKVRITSFYNNIGSLYYEMNELDKAEKFFSNGLQIALKLKDKSRIAQFYYAIGALHNKMKHFDKAIKELKKAVNLFEAIGEKPGVSMCLVELGSAYVNAGSVDVGLSYLQQSEAMASDIGYVQVTEEEIFEKMIHAYVAKGDYEKAFNYQNKYLQIKEKTRSKEKTNAILDLQAKYEAKFRTKEQQQKIALLDREKALERNKLYFLLAGVFFLLFVAGVLFWYNVLKQKANHALEQTNEELKEAKVFAEKAANAKEEFLSTMSHEIRTPLNAVLGMTNLLLDEQPRPDQMEYLETLQFSANNLLTLINDILDFSKIESGRIDFEDISFDVERLLSDIVESFKFSRKNSSIDIVLDQDEIPFELIGDTTRLTQIFTNLIGNAVKFTKKGHVKIISKLISHDEQFATMRFAVEDTGIGIPSHRLEAIFDSFSQADTDTTRLYGGTGLGLAITKRLVEMHGSKVMVESVVGEGTTFYFEVVFPISQQEKKEFRPSQTSLALNGLEGVRILLAEDNKINQLVARKILAKWKVEIDVAENGLEAIELLKHNDYEIILMDIHMPKMDGYEATKLIRQMEDKTKSNIPIIALTASAFSSVAKKTTLVGMNDHVGKPFKPEELFQKMMHHLANARKAKNVIGIAVK